MTAWPRCWPGPWPSAWPTGAWTTAAEYAQVREQFGRPIGQFQAVKHRCADMLVALEAARAATWDAARTCRRRRAPGGTWPPRPPPRSPPTAGFALRQGLHPGARRHRLHVGARRAPLPQAGDVAARTATAPCRDAPGPGRRGRGGRRARDRSIELPPEEPAGPSVRPSWSPSSAADRTERSGATLADGRLPRAALAGDRGATTPRRSTSSSSTRSSRAAGHPPAPPPGGAAGCCRR